MVLDTYGSVVEVTPPYSRIEALLTTAQIEYQSASVIGQEAYFDELHEFYEQEFKLIKEKLIHLESTKALL